MHQRLAVFLLVIGAMTATGATLALWDVARVASTGVQTYWLPFMIVQLPWYVAADLFVLLNFLGIIALASGTILYRKW